MPSTYDNAFRALNTKVDQLKQLIHHQNEMLRLQNKMQSIDSALEMLHRRNQGHYPFNRFATRLTPMDLGIQSSLHRLLPKILIEFRKVEGMATIVFSDDEREPASRKRELRDALSDEIYYLTGTKPYLVLDESMKKLGIWYSEEDFVKTRQG